MQNDVPFLRGLYFLHLLQWPLAPVLTIGARRANKRGSVRPYDYGSTYGISYRSACATYRASRLWWMQVAAHVNNVDEKQHTSAAYSKRFKLLRRRALFVRLNADVLIFLNVFFVILI